MIYMGLGFKGSTRRWSFLSLSSFLSLLVNPSSQWWLYSQLEVLCVVILAFFCCWIHFIKFLSFLFVLAFQTTSFLLHFEFGTLLLLHELQIVVQAPSFDICFHNSIFKLCCCIWISTNDVFRQWLHITFTSFSFPFFCFWCCFCFHVIVYKLLYSFTYCMQQQLQILQNSSHWVFLCSFVLFIFH
jgi:hypothetical protein